jgi:NADP-dependent 3-hydroxy acid dehydrogenase YdfG
MQAAGKLAGQTALITGGGSGIGAATAKRFANEGARVVIVGRTESKLRETAERIGRPDQVAYRVADAGVADEAWAAATWTLEHFGGRLDILVNNAGINLVTRSTLSLTPDTWRQVIQANLDSAFYFTRAVLPAMQERKNGTIVNVSSVAGIRASTLGGTAYSASKFGMAALGLCVGLEGKNHGIRSTVIYPGEVDTPILDHRPEPVPPERRAVILKPDDVAEAILFVVALRPGISIPEMIITPTTQSFA